jgi:hypothetical protein
MILHAMFWWILPRDPLILSIILIVIINILLYWYYSIMLKQKLKSSYPILINIIYMSFVIYWVYYFWFL